MTAKCQDYPLCFDIGPVTKAKVFEAVAAAKEYWPNAHLGDISPREDIASAFRIMRRRVAAGSTLYQAACAVEIDAFRHADM